MVFEGELSASRPRRFSCGNGHMYPLNRRLGLSQSRSGIFGESLEPRIMQPVT